MVRASRILAAYSKSVFINCPFDDTFKPLFHAIVYTIYDMGFLPKCAKDKSNAGQTRIDKIYDLIDQCKYSVHDISRTEPDAINNLPRFNMPLELGLDLGCKNFGQLHHKEKVILILDTEPYRFQKYISDIAGQDIDAHANDVAIVIEVVRNWLRREVNYKKFKTPSGKEIYRRYQDFEAALPTICTRMAWDIKSLPFIDFSAAAAEWIQNNPI
ncbi:MAG: hypothetical protein QOH96_4172 [Blastocatellia bacterium]|jgi:hypothetical protein|nr:hypothetical protein [Blastocatellia bacterium]